VVEAKDLEKYGKIQVEEFVYEILDWQDGHFVFRERPVTERDCATWIPVESLLMEGARRADELSALATTLESTRAVPRLSERAATERGVLDLTPGEWEVVGRVDGFSDVKSIAWTLGRSEFDVSKVVSTLAEKGVLEITSQEAARSRAPIDVLLDEVEEQIEAATLDSARHQLEGVLEDNPQEPRAHYLAARIREWEGDLKGAAKGYETALGLDPLAEEARRRLGLVRLKLGDIDGAAHEWTGYLRVMTDGPERRQVERALTAVRELQVIIDELNGRED
jgi:tetratricopeptide (TPR) repeat protein